MSYILDALRKSEQERNASREMQDSAPETGDLPAGRSSSPTTKLVMLAVIVAIGLVVTWRRATSPAPTEIARAAPAPTEATTVKPPANDELAAQLETRRTDPRPAMSPALPTTISVAAPIDPASIPFLRQMPDDFRHRLPPMTVNIHVYSPDEAQCMLYINNHEYRNGETIDGGARLERIVEDGAVLSYEGRYFKLARPN